MGILNLIGLDIDSGDPEVKTWFLVRQNNLPLILCLSYLAFTKVLGPAFMRNRKPYDLRTPMMIYNIGLVLFYSTMLVIAIIYLPKVDRKLLCTGGILEKGTLPYTLMSFGWTVYLVKYVEFLDTVFFVLRKKYNLVTNLHVIHHALLPLIGWVILRTERSGFQVFPVILNSMIHIVMYAYYALAAMGPEMRKYLWWKRYLTIMQMAQFVLILFFIAVILPVSGCRMVKFSVYMNFGGALFFFALFYNFYRKRFAKPTKESAVTDEDVNGNSPSCKTTKCS